LVSLDPPSPLLSLPKPLQDERGRGAGGEAKVGGRNRWLKISRGQRVVYSQKTSMPMLRRERTTTMPIAGSMGMPERLTRLTIRPVRRGALVVFFIDFYFFAEAVILAAALLTETLDQNLPEGTLIGLHDREWAIGVVPEVIKGGFKGAGMLQLGNGFEGITL
jgi:hypothetical protein